MTGPPAEARPNTDPVPDPGPTTPSPPYPLEAHVSNISKYMLPPSSYKALFEEHCASVTPTRSNTSPTSSPPGTTAPAPAPSVDFVVATDEEAHNMASVSGGSTTTVPMNVDIGDLVDQVTDELRALQSGQPSTQGKEYTPVIAKSKKKAKKKANRTDSISATILLPLGCLQRGQNDSSSSSSPSSNDIDTQSTSSSNKFSAQGDPDPNTKPDFQQAETD